MQSLLLLLHNIPIWSLCISSFLDSRKEEQLNDQSPVLLLIFPPSSLLPDDAVLAALPDGHGGLPEPRLRLGVGVEDVAVEAQALLQLGEVVPGGKEEEGREGVLL